MALARCRSRRAPQREVYLTRARFALDFSRRAGVFDFKAGARERAGALAARAATTCAAAGRPAWARAAAGCAAAPLPAERLRRVAAGAAAPGAALGAEAAALFAAAARLPKRAPRAGAASSNVRHSSTVSDWGARSFGTLAFFLPSVMYGPSRPF